MKKPKMRLTRWKITAGAFAAFALWSSNMRGEIIFVPNGSFESPPNLFADPAMDAWQKSPQPIWYPPGPFAWDQVMGEFLNSSNGSPDHIINMDGLQGAYLFALPDAAIFQDFNTVSGTNTASTHGFNAQFEAGKSYTLTVGVLGNGGGMSNGVTLEMSLYYRDVSNNIVPVATRIITNSGALFPNRVLFTDFQVRLPIVRAGDAWSGKHIGIRFASTANFGNQGGYWDIDNARLTESIAPNYSFETPPNDFADPGMDAWQKAPRPLWYPDGGQFTWDQLMGEFVNTSNGSANYIDNMDGNQAGYIFAVPDVFIFQDNNSIGGTNLVPTHDLNAKFEVGKEYALTIGLLGGGGGMLGGVPFQISLYYRDASSNMATVVSTIITNDPSVFPTNTHLTDFQARVPTVKSNDAWAGKNIGIKLASLADFINQGGYWDLDKVRLTETIPNGSFEFPTTAFADPNMNAWQKSPQPFWYPGPFPWDQLMGQFLNTAQGSPSHIDNMDGNQAAFLFALPDVAIFQDYASAQGTNAPTHDFSATYEVGKSYNLTVGVIGGGGGMSNGVTLEISFYYRDAASNLVSVAATTVTNSPTTFPTNTHFADFQVVAPIVKFSDPWAGKKIGVKLASTANFLNQGGYWDVDRVRLQAVRDPLLSNLSRTNGRFNFTLSSAPGRLEILSTTNLNSPPSNWISLGTLTNLTGSMSFTDSVTNLSRRFYRARQAP